MSQHVDDRIRRAIAEARMLEDAIKGAAASRDAASTKMQRDLFADDCSGLVVQYKTLLSYIRSLGGSYD